MWRSMSIEMCSHFHRFYLRFLLLFLFEIWNFRCKNYTWCKGSIFVNKDDYVTTMTEHSADCYPDDRMESLMKYKEELKERALASSDPPRHPLHWSSPRGWGLKWKDVVLHPSPGIGLHGLESRLLCFALGIDQIHSIDKKTFNI